MLRDVTECALTASTSTLAGVVVFKPRGRWRRGWCLKVELLTASSKASLSAYSTSSGVVGVSCSEASLAVLAEASAVVASMAVVWNEFQN